MRTRITLACFVIGLALIGIRFLNLTVTDAFRPYVLYAGIGLLLLGLVLVVTRPAIDETPASRDVQPTADVAVLEPAAPPVAPARAEVTLRVGANGASESSVRWYHVAAATGTDVAARKAHVTVAVRGEQVAAERWRWQDGDPAVDLTQSGARIPILIGRVMESVAPFVPGTGAPSKDGCVTQN